MQFGNDNVTPIRQLKPWEKQCIHDIVDICREEGIPLSFGMRHYTALKTLYSPGADLRRQLTH